MKHLLLLLFLLNFTHCNRIDTSQATEEEMAIKAPVTGIRIAWDNSSLTKVSSSTTNARYNGYARAIQLPDQSLLCVYESDGHIVAVKSADAGATWSEPVVVATRQEGINMAVPDILLLQDQSILVCYNPWPFKIDPSRRFAIRTKKSYDGGITWKDERLLYEAGYQFENGCWEPAAIQLPDGEIQLFFANEGMYTASDEQNISLLRSTDGGLTWSTKPQMVSFRSGSRDGMPSPLLLKNGKDIVFAIEDNGSGNFKPYIIRSTVTNNWQKPVEAISLNRIYALADTLPDEIYAGAPYMRQLQTGETILSYQGTENRPNKMDHAEMKVVIGDSEAKQFDRKTVPFAIPAEKSGLWNSLSILRGDTIIALTSTNAFSMNGSVEVWMIKGYVIPELQVIKQSISVDGLMDEPVWQKTFPIFIGHKSATQASSQVSYDNHFLFVITKVKNNKVVSNFRNTEENDGITVFVNTTNRAHTQPQTGVFSVFLSAGNKLLIKKGNNRLWIETNDATGVQYAVKKTVTGYIQELAIPWALLKIMPAPGTNIGLNISLIENTGKDAADYRESISAAGENQPYSWPALVLQ